MRLFPNFGVGSEHVGSFGLVGVFGPRERRRTEL
jgi:hypothetical protein